MKRDFPHSLNVTSLIRSMKPNKRYFLFEIRELTGWDYDKSYKIRSVAKDYGLVQEEQIFGRIYQCVLTEKGCSYHDKLTKMSSVDFFNLSSEEEKKQKCQKKRVPYCYRGVKRIKELGLNPKVPYAITSSGEKHLALMRTQSLVSKHKMKRRELKEYLILSALKKEPTDLINLSSELHKTDEQIKYVHHILPLVKNGKIKALED